MRLYCLTCRYPQRTCICRSISPIKSCTRIDILQHPCEAKQAKNTARLVSLCMPTAQLWIGETPNDFAELIDELNNDSETITALVYPSESAQSVTLFCAEHLLEEHLCEKQLSEEHLCKEQLCKGPNAAPKIRLLYLDGTWKKTFKLLKINSWLHHIPHIKLDNPTSNYRIRHTSVNNGISTLESVEQTLKILEPELNTQPLLNCFAQLQNNFDIR